MDAEHRHELKENDLAEFLHHSGQFWSKWGNSILLGLLIGLAVVFGLHHFRTRSAQKLEQALTDLHLETTAAGLADIADRTDLVAVKAEAYLRAGQLLLNRAVLPDAPGADAPRTAEQRTADLADAQAMLQHVIELPDASAAFGLNARLTLGAIAESQRQWDQAAQIYQAIEQDAAKDYPPLAQRATIRLAMLDRLKQPVRLAPDPPKPAEADATAADAIEAAAPATPADAPPADAGEADGS